MIGVVLVFSFVFMSSVFAKSKGSSVPACDASLAAKGRCMVGVLLCWLCRLIF